VLGGAFHGHAGIRDYLREFTDTFEEYRIEIERIVDRAGPVRRVSASARASQAKRSRPRLAGHFAARIRDRRPWRVAACPSEQDALEAAGRRRQEAPRGP
jgi:hypothetical protein